MGRAWVPRISSTGGNELSGGPDGLWEIVHRFPGTAETVDSMPRGEAPQAFLNTVA